METESPGVRGKFQAWFSGGKLEGAARFANTAAGLVVGKPGTATVERGELIARLAACFERSAAVDTLANIGLMVQTEVRRISACRDRPPQDV